MFIEGLKKTEPMVQTTEPNHREWTCQFKGSYLNIGALKRLPPLVALSMN